MTTALWFDLTGKSAQPGQNISGRDIPATVCPQHKMNCAISTRQIGNN
jgi:hypothetical protein